MEINNKGADADEHKRNSVLARRIAIANACNHISVLDLSHRNLTSLDENVKVPASLEDLNLSHNSLAEIPKAVMELKGLKRLNVTFNEILYFDETPQFMQSIEYLNMSNNQLARPPYWVWSGAPKKLEHLNISCNPKITNSFQLKDGYYKDLIQYKPIVKEVVLFNCRLHRHLELLATFAQVKALELGKADLARFNTNLLDCIPCKGLDKCYDIMKLNISNTQLRRIETNINIYQQLQVINLAENNINCLPNEFTELEKLETCILSWNKLIYLPDKIVQMKCLKQLYVDSNELCSIPKDLGKLRSLKLLDLYDNRLYDVLEELDNVQELDLAMNYFEEPDSQKYLEKKEKLRMLTTDKRENGCKVEVERSDSEHSLWDDYLDDDEEIIENDLDKETSKPECSNQMENEDEDWDSDDYWVPNGKIVKSTPPAHPPWYYLIKHKMAEGNFCPMDAHVQPLAERVTLERLRNAKVRVEVEGQFDDLTDDDS